jgi:hypothetical protein
VKVIQELLVLRYLEPSQHILEDVLQALVGPVLKHIFKLSVQERELAQAAASPLPSH